jgi:uncharacterized protein
VGPWCPVELPRVRMVHRWDQLTFLHWSYDPAAVQAVLPEGLTVETFDGRAWVGLVPFAMQVTLPDRGPVPWLSRFPETNVRTYVVAADGTAGIWFLSLDAARLAAVVTARSGYRLPYFWSSMQLSEVDSVTTYRSRRRWPRRSRDDATCDVVVEAGQPFAAHELSDLDHWLTARWRLFIDEPRGMRRILARHDPWPLHHCEVRHLDQTLVQAAGLPAPQGPPLAHWSPGVEVRIGPRERLP